MNVVPNASTEEAKCAKSNWRLVQCIVVQRICGHFIVFPLIGSGKCNGPWKEEEPQNMLLLYTFFKMWKVQHIYTCFNKCDNQGLREEGDTLSCRKGSHATTAQLCSYGYQTYLWKTRLILSEWRLKRASSMDSTNEGLCTCTYGL